MPFARASPANCCFQASKPAAELPHWAAWAWGLKQASMARVRKVAVVSCLLLVIRKFLGWPALAAKPPHLEITRQPPRSPRRSQPGAASKPFGQVGAPSSRNTRAKKAGSRSGSAIGPPSPTMAEKSYSPAMPSLNVARRRCSPRHFIFATLIIIEARNFDERRTGTRPPPIILQFAAMRQCPLLHKPCGVGGQIGLR